MSLFASHRSSRRTTIGYLKCSTANGILIVHTSIRIGKGWKKQEQALEPGASIQLKFSEVLVGPLGFSKGQLPDTSYMRRPDEPPAENAPDDYEDGFTLPVHVQDIGWLDWTSSSGYLKSVVDDLYDIWLTGADGNDTLCVTFMGFVTRYNKQYLRDYYVPDLQPQPMRQSGDFRHASASKPEPRRTASGPMSDQPTDANLDDDGIPF